MAKKSKRKYSPGAGTEVKREMHRYKRGKAKSGKGGRCIFAMLQHGSDALPHPAMGTWTLTVQRTGGSQGVADFWISKWSLNTLTAPTFSTFVDSSCTITSPATADSAIVTGSFTFKTQWTNGNGQPSFYPGAPPMQALVPYSGRGPRRSDNLTRPDVLAPGFMVPAAFEKNKRAGRREYLRARLTPQGHAEVFRSEGSGRIRSISWASGLVELGDGARQVVPGDLVRFLPYASFGL